MEERCERFTDCRTRNRATTQTAQPAPDEDEKKKMRELKTRAGGTEGDGREREGVRKTETESSRLLKSPVTIRLCQIYCLRQMTTRGEISLARRGRSQEKTTEPTLNNEHLNSRLWWSLVVLTDRGSCGYGGSGRVGRNEQYTYSPN